LTSEQPPSTSKKPKKKPNGALRALVAACAGMVGGGAVSVLLRFLQFLLERPFLASGWQSLLMALGFCACAVFGWIGAPAVVEAARKHVDRFERFLSDMPAPQVVATALGLLVGLTGAMLATQPVREAAPLGLGFGVTLSACVLLGYLCARYGHRHWRGMPWNTNWNANWDARMAARYGKAAALPESPAPLPGAWPDEPPPPLPMKLLDTNIFLDGRLPDVAKAGFLEGRLFTVTRVLDELRGIAGSADALRRARGRRALDMLSDMSADAANPLRVLPADPRPGEDTDALLLRLCLESGAKLVTLDRPLTVAAKAAGVPVLNLDALTDALRPVLLPGETLEVRIAHAGREPGQGVGYLEDGAMAVVEGASAHLDRTVRAKVKKTLKTNAGRMVFCEMTS